MAPQTQIFQGDTMLDRRDFLAVCSRFGLTTTLLPGVLWAMADEKGKITREMIDNAAAIADVHILDEYKEMMLDSLTTYAKDYEAIYFRSCIARYEAADREAANENFSHA
jgi:hypothetical protein